MVEHESAALEAYRRISDAALASQPWLITDSRTVTFGQLSRRIRAIAALLPQWRLSPGDRVVISTRDDCEAAQLFIGFLCNGVTAVNIDADAGAERARSLIAKAAPGLVVADREIAEHWDVPRERYPLIELLPEAPRKLFGRKAPERGGLHALLDACAPAEPRSPADEETLAYIMFTSGTTDQPKGVCISHRALFAHLATLRRRYQYGASSRIMNTLMLAHADGMIQGPVMGFFAAIPVYRPMRFEVSAIERLLDSIYQLRITHLIAVPTMLSLIQELGLSQRDAFQGGDFRLLVSCGAQLDAALCESFERTFQVPLINVYGLTETVVGGVFAGPDGQSRMPGGIGLPEDCELRIVDGEGREAAPGQPGELMMRGELLMSGYFDAPELTAEVLTGGWLRTGDVATRDAAGRYRITGRIKNIVIRGGYNIHPEEITEVLRRHPAVQDAVTFGVADATWGETVASLVVAADSVSNEELLAHCSRHLEPRKVPSRLERAGSLPRGLSGKVIIERARELLLQQSNRAPAPASAARKGAEDADRVLAVAAGCFKAEGPALTLASQPRDVPGWDSLAHLEFVYALEKEFDLKLSARDIMGLDRLDKALELVRRGAPAAR